LTKPIQLRFLQTTGFWSGKIQNFEILKKNKIDKPGKPSNKQKPNNKSKNQLVYYSKLFWRKKQSINQKIRAINW
jgi:hypothetical protein